LKHTLTPQRYLILLAVMPHRVGGRHTALAWHGAVGPVSLAHLGLLLAAIRNPWVITGILCLLGFFASYLTALSWADLTFFVLAGHGVWICGGCSALQVLLHETIPSTLGRNPADRLWCRICRQRARRSPCTSRSTRRMGPLPQTITLCDGRDAMIYAGHIYAGDRDLGHDSHSRRHGGRRATC